MSDYQPSDIRISDAEREDALAKLGEHMSAGRLDIEEFGERSAKVTAAKTRGELLSLFGDLPEPKPVFGRPVVTGAPLVPRQRTFLEKAAPVAAILAIIGVMVLFRLWFFVPFLVIFLMINGFDSGPRDRRRRMWHERGW